MLFNKSVNYDEKDQFEQSNIEESKFEEENSNDLMKKIKINT